MKLEKTKMKIIKKKANKQTQEQMGGWLNRFNFGCA